MCNRETKIPLKESHRSWWKLKFRDRHGERGWMLKLQTAWCMNGGGNQTKSSKFYLNVVQRKVHTWSEIGKNNLKNIHRTQTFCTIIEKLWHRETSVKKCVQTSALRYKKFYYWSRSTSHCFNKLTSTAKVLISSVENKKKFNGAYDAPPSPKQYSQRANSAFPQLELLVTFRNAFVNSFNINAK